MCTFEPEKHLYRDPFGRTMTSVTTMLHSAFPEFDAETASTAKAAKLGCDPADLRSAWAQKSAAACRYGTRVHRHSECRLLGIEPDVQPEDVREQQAMAAAGRMCDTILASLEIVGVEKIVFSLLHCVAGTVDLLCRDRNGYWLLDWKTNEDIRKGSWGRKGLHPVSHMDDTPISRYGLQLGTYELILRREGHIPTDSPVRRALLWVPPYQRDAEFIELPDLSAEVADILDHRAASAPLWPFRPDVPEFAAWTRLPNLPAWPWIESRAARYAADRPWGVGRCEMAAALDAAQFAAYRTAAISRTEAMAALEAA